MPRPLDPILKEVLERYGENPRDTQGVVWDCHGTWVVYHKALERVAAKAGITFEPPLVLEANGAGKCAALCVSARLGERTDWSIGEASPGNNKNTYPFAMAEKRARDRVILKLVGLAGLAYSEEEADEFKGGQPAPSPANEPDPAQVEYIRSCWDRIKHPAATEAELREWWRSQSAARRSFDLSQALVDEMKAALGTRLETFKVAA